MSKVKLNIRNLSATELIARARQVGAALTGNPHWFRVMAVTSAGQSGWSDPATKLAP